MKRVLVAFAWVSVLTFACADGTQPGSETTPLNLDGSETTSGSADSTITSGDSSTSTDNDDPCTYQEASGLLVIEAETADLTDTNWAFRNTANPGYLDVVLSDYVGDGYIEYTGEDSFNRPTDNAISYTFTIHSAGTYFMGFRAYKNHTHNPDVDDPAKYAEDRNNDSYVKMEGDFEADTSFESNGNYGAELAPLTEFTKHIVLGDGTAWSRTQNLEVASHEFAMPIYKFKAGHEYTLSIIGRSTQYAIDRLYFIRQYDENGASEGEGYHPYRGFRRSISNGEHSPSTCS